MSSSIPQRHSPQFTPAPLPIPTRRPTHRANPSLADSDDGSLGSHNSSHSNSNNHLMTQHPYKDADEDPLRALCHALNVAETAPSRAHHLTNSHELTVLDRASPVLPTHVLAVHDAPPTDPNAPVMLIPIDIDAFSRKLRVDIAGARQHPHPPTRILPAVALSAAAAAVAGAPLPPTVTVPVVPLQVPHVPSIALLLVYALGVRANPSALAAALLPLSVAEEFPSSAAMAQAMAALCERDTSDALPNGSGVGGAGAGGWQLLDRYTVYNHGIWKNVLKLGLQDSRVMSVVQTVWNVTAESRKILARQRERWRERD
ncbi:hypothetical protein BC826DRAFT_69026 [Russula brevipes]|nr:hypothetical protein BC826DRAFT_69026 [Russula brevipes]